MRNFTTIARKINARIGRAIHDHNLIEEGDRILVAVSGGKDSLTLLDFLKQIQSWAPVGFKLFAVHVKTDFHCGDCVHDEVLIKIFNELNVEYRFCDVKVLDDKGKTSCFWCSWNRRKELFKITSELKCNKLALGHHKDDIVETVLMNMICNGEISTMNPKQELFDGKINIIRPLCYVEEFMTKKYSKEKGFPQQICKCPFGVNSKRKYMKDLVKQIEKDIPGTNIKTNIYESLSRIKDEYIDLKSERSEIESSVFI